MPVTNYYTVNGQIIGEKTTGGSRVDYLTDALGSVTATVDQNAAVVNTYRYKPYGAQLAKTGVGADPSLRWVGAHGYRQTGKEFAGSYVRARTYSRQTGTWSTKVPGQGGENFNDYSSAKQSGTWRTKVPGQAREHPYVYSSANPTSMVDPSGLRPCDAKVYVAVVLDCTMAPPLSPSELCEHCPSWCRCVGNIAYTVQFRGKLEGTGLVSIGLGLPCDYVGATQSCDPHYFDLRSPCPTILCRRMLCTDPGKCPDRKWLYFRRMFMTGLPRRTTFDGRIAYAGDLKGVNILQCL